MNSIARVNSWVWALIYGGMAVFGLGLAVGSSDDTLSWGFIGFGAVLVLAGVTLIWVRSRMQDANMEDAK